MTKKKTATRKAAKKKATKKVAKKPAKKPSKKTAPKGTNKRPAARASASPSQLIDRRIEELGDWRGAMLSRVRSLLKKTVPDVAEEWKWRGVPVWYRNGIICTGETYKAVVKLTFFKGAALEDPAKLFNASLEGNARRAIDIHQGESIDERALADLFRAAVAANGPSARS